MPPPTGHPAQLGLGLAAVGRPAYINLGRDEDLGADRSRALLGDRLSLYQIHSATLESGVLEDAEVLALLAELRASGVAVGLSTTGPAQAATIDRALELDAFDAVQSTWNLLKRSAGPALARAHAAGLQVVVKEGVANGRLTVHGAPPALREAAASEGGGGWGAAGCARARSGPRTAVGRRRAERRRHAGDAGRQPARARRRVDR